ncbi:MAG TPA: DHH family phosphoesterase [Candidatus Saccharimonadales bacterium]|nr:DHH family phosphoesterase [Candidatus Saccharimonadales bacterium]
MTDQNKTGQLLKLINESQKILITAHIGPDGDSVSSSLLASLILHENFPEKTIQVVMEEEPRGLDFLLGIETIQVRPVPQSISDYHPDLLIILDANTVNRITRYPDQARDSIAQAAPKVVIIDHHEPKGVENNDLYINDFSPAVTFDIFDLFIQKLGLKKPAGYAQLAMTGIYTDTGGFVNRNLNYKKTFEALPKLIEDGADIEKIASAVNRISDKGYEFFKIFIENLKLEKDYTYTFLPDESLKDNGEDILEAVKESSDLIRSSFLRTIGGRGWGFIVYKDLLAPEQLYSVSFRSLSTGKDVSLLAAKLGGGGHKPAAGAKIKAASVNEALEKIRQAISQA